MASLLSKRPTKKHVEYTSIETDAVINGVKILGDNPGRWAEIKRMFPAELAQRSSLQIRDHWLVVKRRLTLNDAQESTAQVLNITSPQQAQQLSTRQTFPTSQIAFRLPAQVQVQPIAPVTLRAIQQQPTTALVSHLQPAQVQTQPQPATTLVPHLQQAQVQGQPIAPVHVPMNQVPTGFTSTASRVTRPLVHTMATVSPQGEAAVQVWRAPFPTSSPTATAPTLTTSQYLQMMSTLPNHITNPNSNVIEVLTHLLDDNDSPNHYTSTVRPTISTTVRPTIISIEEARQYDQQ